MGNASHNFVPVLTFHKIDDSFEWGVTRTTPSQFRRILEFLKYEGYESIPLKMLRHPNFELPSKPIVLTFDDSYESIYTHAFPLMMEIGFRGTVFIITGYVGQMNTWDVNLGWKKFKHLSWDQILQMQKKGFELGSHTVHHPDLTWLNPFYMRSELDRSKKKIEDKTGEEVRFISFPFGRYNRHVIETALDCGYENGCGFWIRKKDKKRKETFVFERKAYYLFDGLWNLKAKLNRNAWTSFEDVKLRIVNYCSHGSSLVKRTKIEFE
ncbi:MAG: polysaccharide deacetylase family protein [bacterium]